MNRKNRKIRMNRNKRIISCIFTGMVLFLLGCGQTNEIVRMEPEKKESSYTHIYVFPEEGISFQETLDRAVPGQTIYLREGTYVGPFDICKSGTKDAPITICAYPGEQVFITAPEGFTGGILNLYEVAYVTISGLSIGNATGEDICGIYLEQSDNNVIIGNNEICGLTTSDPDNANGGGASAILLYGEGKTEDTAIHHVLIQNNRIHDNINGWSENISVAGNVEYVQVLNNEVYRNTNIGIDFYGNAGYCRVQALDQPRFCEASGNIVYDCVCSYAECAGIYVDGARDIEIKNNICHGNAYGIEIGSEERQDDYPVKNILVENNEIYENSCGGLRVGGFDETATGWVTDSVIRNNILRDNGLGEGGYNGAIYFAKVDNILVEQNQIYQNSTDFPMIGGGDVSEAFTKNVRFVENQYYSNKNPEELSFEFRGKTLSGITAFNQYTGGTDQAFCLSGDVTTGF